MVKKTVSYCICAVLIILLTACQQETVVPSVDNENVNVSKFQDVKWKYSIGLEGGDEVTSLVIDGANIFASTRYGKVASINKTNGEEIWSFLTPENTDGKEFINCILDSGDAIYVSSNNGIYSLNKLTGNQNWHHPLDYIVVCPSVSGNDLYFGNSDSVFHFYSINKTTGETNWEAHQSDNSENAVITPPIVDGDNLYFYGSNGDLNEINRFDGKQVWGFSTELAKNDYNENPIGGQYSSSLLLKNGIMYFGSWDGNIYAIDTINRKELWRFKSDRIEKSPVISEDTISFVSEKTLYGLNIKTGELKWQKPTDSFSNLILDNDMIYYASQKANSISAVNIHNGEERLNYKTGDLVTQLAISDNTLFFGSEDGFIYAKTINN